jgi:hypothetical protein
LLIVLTVNSSFAQSLSQLEKKATESFNKKDYASALIDFRQLLAQNPTSMDFNFKYGVCVFYSDNRKNAKRYFDFVLRQRDFPSETYYFVAKLSHFEYKFSSAMLYYQKYLDNTPEKLRDHDVKMELDQCANGKTLLKSPKALRLINAVEVAIPKFYMNYQLESRTGGFFTDEALQSKMDKKFNHLPMYYFLRGDSLKFFASYGTSTNKDIYFVRKIGADAWSPAIKINDQVNSLLDEDFPFYDQKNGTLYFSSRGHNSIGGYDLFKATFDPSSNSADNRSNFDFPYSSADDDFLFVPEIDQKKAYFSSNRNCERNKIEVYSVEYSTINSTIQLIKGDFHDLLDEKNKMAQIKVINVNTSEEFGPFTTDENGKYSLLIPGSGDYKFSVTVDGSRETFIGTATVPVAKNNNVLKQTLTYSVVESDEHMEFANYFNLSELASEDDKIIVLNAIASLKMNPTLIQNKVIIPTETMDTKAVLAELGYDKLNQKDALTKMNDDLISVELQEEELSIDLTKAALLQKENISYLSTLDNLIKEVKNEVNDPTISPNDKLVLLEKLKDLQEDKIELQQQIIALNQLIEQKESALEANRKLELTKKAAELNEKLIDLSLLNSDDSVKVFLVENKETIQSLLAANVTDETDVDSEALEKELANKNKLLEAKRLEIKKESDSLNNAVSELEKTKISASKKEIIAIDQQIVAVQQEAGESSKANGLIIKELVIEEQELQIEIAKIEIQQELKNNNVSTIDAPLTDSKIELPAITMADITALTEEKNDIALTINQLNKENKVLVELVAKIEEVKQQEDSQEKFQSLLDLLSKKEQELQGAIKEAEATNDFLTVNKNMEELQSLKSEQEKYTVNLKDLVASENVEKLPTQEELAANVEKKRVEEELANIEKKRVEEELANVEKKRVEEELLAKQEKLTSEEQIVIAEKKRVEEDELAKVEKKRVEEELLANQEKLTSEEQIAAKAEKKRVEEELANVEKKRVEGELANAEKKRVEDELANAEKKRVEEELVAKQEKLTSEEQIAANAEKKRVEEQIVIAEKKRVEEELLANQEKLTSEEQIAANAEKKRVEEQIVIAEKKRVEEELLANQEKLTSEEQIAANAEKKRVEEELANVEKKRVEEELANVEKKRVEEELANAEKKRVKEELANVEKKRVEEELANAEKKAAEEQLAYAEKKRVEEALVANQENLASEEQIAANTEKKRAEVELAANQEKLSSEEQLVQIDSPNSKELIKVMEETKILEKSALTAENKALEEENKKVSTIINSTNSLLVNQLVLSNKIQELENEFPALENSTFTSNDEARNTLIIQEKLLEELRKKETGERLSLIDKQLKIIKNQIDQLDGNKEVIPVNTTENFLKENELAEKDIVELKSKPEYTEYLQKRIAYNRRALQLDSINKVIASDKQKLDYLIQQSTGTANISTVEREKAKSINENILLAEKLTQKLTEEAKVILSLPNQLKMEAMLAEKIEPIQLIAKTNAPSYEFIVGNPITTNAALPLPVLSASPSGLLYRIQVGAFRKPIAVDKFREFTPVSGEVLQNGLTCYLAGYFNNKINALTARKSIRNLGYADAFIVAYCDGKRISLFEAAELERSGRCIAKTQNEISLEVAELYKNAAPTTIPATELKKEAVFYCVQVGVYNKPIAGKQLANIEELESHISPNGQYRYTSGQFLNMEDAKLRKKVIVQKGITDAYIVAYRNGKPIDMNLAKTLLQQQQLAASEQVVTVDQVVKIDFNQLASPAILNVEYVQFIKTMDSDITNELLGGLNRGGTFVFDPNQKSVVSGFIDLNDISAFERIYYADMSMVAKSNDASICVVSADEGSISASMHDWLLHCTIPYSILPKTNTFEIQFILSNDNQLTTIKAMADKLDYTYKLSQL